LIPGAGAGTVSQPVFRSCLTSSSSAARRSSTCLSSARR
jgi:hypothetical protein